MSTALLPDAGFVFEERRNFYISPDTFKSLYPAVTPFLTNATPDKPVTTPDPDFKMFEFRQPWMDQHFSITSVDSNWDNSAKPNSNATIKIGSIVGMNNSSGSFISNDTSWIRYEITLWDKNELVYKGHAVITGVTDQSITLTALGRATDADEKMADLAVDDIGRVVTRVRGENQTAGEAWHKDMDIIYNSAQIMDLPIQISGTLKAAALRGARNELARLRVNKAEEWKVLQENFIWFGYRSGGLGSAFNPNSVNDTFVLASRPKDADGNVLRTTMGVITALQRYGNADDTSDEQNVFNREKAKYSYSAFVDDMDKKFKYTPAKGYFDAYCAPDVLNFFNKITRGRGSFLGNSGWSELKLGDLRQDRLGFHFRWLETDSGLLRLIPVPLFRTRGRGLMVMIDPSLATVVTYRPDAFRANVKTDDDYDGEKDVYFADKGLKLELLERHAMLWLR